MPSPIGQCSALLKTELYLFKTELMVTRINSNIGALSSINQMKKHSSAKELNLKQLAGGDRITEAAVDPAGLAISETMRAKAQSQKQGIRNINDGIGLIHTAEGHLSSIGQIGTRLKEIAIKSSNASWSQSERKIMDNEFQSLKNEMQRISETAEFNGQKLLDGSGKNIDFQVGFRGDSNSRMRFNTNDLNSSVSRLGISSASVKSQNSSQNSLGKLDDMIDKISEKRSQLGAMSMRMETASNNGSSYLENTLASKSRIRDLDMAKGASEKARLNIISSATTSSAVHHNTNPQKALRLIG